jgi:hypothetical protein
MNITVVKDNTPNLIAITGGGYAISDYEIHIDSSLNEQDQIETLVHEILEIYLIMLPHEKIEELTTIISHGIDLLKDTA